MAYATEIKKPTSLTIDQIEKLKLQLLQKYNLNLMDFDPLNPLPWIAFEEYHSELYEAGIY